MRDYIQIERYLNRLLGDVYPQPPDRGHQKSINDLETWMSRLTTLKSVLDVGCGQGQALRFLNRFAERVEGVTLGTDVEIALQLGYLVHNADMSFLPYNDREFNLIFARHVLEHSPFPILTLMEWHRVSKQWLLLIVPDPAHFGVGGQNHYSVLYDDQWRVSLDRGGWHILWSDHIRSKNEKNLVPEYRYFCEKKP